MSNTYTPLLECLRYKEDGGRAPILEVKDGDKWVAVPLVPQTTSDEYKSASVARSIVLTANRLYDKGE